MSVQNMPSELVLYIFKFLAHPADLLNSALTCKAWSLLALELLWYKPSLSRSSAWIAISDRLRQSALSHTPSLFNYNAFLRRINLSLIGPEVTDTNIASLQWCRRLERVTLTGCFNLTDAGLLAFLGTTLRKNLVSIDLSDVSKVTDATILRIAEICPDLQGLNLSMCKEGAEAFTTVTDTSIIFLAKQCPSLRRIKLNNCVKITDEAAIALAQHCPALLEVDLMNCKVSNRGLHTLFEKSRELRELRLNQCANITDAGFTQSALVREPIQTGYYDQLRILDLTNLLMLTDESVFTIVQSAPKIRNLALNKCYNISDESVLSICQLGRYLHYLHLGHCSRITDNSIIQLARKCTRIRYIDLACCTQLTDRSVTELATLPKLKRIGLVKCTNITDQSIYALTSYSRIANSLERVHLSYCNRLSVPAIVQLINFCKNLTHLSLTHVPAFLRHDFQQFRRTPPRDFNEQQQSVFCVFSGKGVCDLRAYLNRHPSFASNVMPSDMGVASSMAAGAHHTAHATTAAVAAAAVDNLLQDTGDALLPDLALAGEEFDGDDIDVL